MTRLNRSVHRDVGYFLSGLMLVYCISGVALNHVDDWNPDFEVVRQEILIPRTYKREEMTPEVISSFGVLVGEGEYKISDFPTSGRVKIYYDNAALLIDLVSRKGSYERVTRRPLVFQTNILHRNSVKGWKWVSDAFSLLLIVLTLTGLFISRGKNGLYGRGKWLVLVGMSPPVAAVIVYELVQR